MSNTLEYYVAPALFSHKNIGDTINANEFNDMALAANSCQAIRTGGGFDLGSYCTLDSGNRRQFFPVYGNTTYFKLYSNLDYHVAGGGGAQIAGSLNSNYGFWGTSQLSCRYFLRVIGSTGFNTGYTSNNDWIAPYRALDVNTYATTVDPNQTAADGAGPLSITYPRKKMGDSICPVGFITMEQAAENGRLTPQTLFSSVFRANNNGYYFIDPRDDLKFMLDNFRATAYFEREALLSREYYVYLLMYNSSTWNFTPATGIDLIVNGEPIAVTTIYDTARLKIIAAPVIPDGDAELSCNDYIRQIISTRTTSAYVTTSGTTTFTAWADENAHTCAATNKIAVLIWVGGRVTNVNYGAF